MPLPHQTPALHLRRIDPTRNMRRFYDLSVEHTLFGGVALVRRWGRVGSCGRTMMETFDTAQDAEAAFARHERRRYRRGYQAVPATANG